MDAYEVIVVNMALLDFLFYLDTNQNMTSFLTISLALVHKHDIFKRETDIMKRIVLTSNENLQ